jgi:hypothetical protein
VRQDGVFIGVEVDDSAGGDPELAKRLEEACPVDIYAAAAGGVQIVLDASPPGAVKVIKLYDGGALLEKAA